MKMLTIADLEKVSNEAFDEGFKSGSQRHESKLTAKVKNQRKELRRLNQLVNLMYRGSDLMRAEEKKEREAMNSILGFKSVFKY